MENNFFWLKWLVDWKSDIPSYYFWSTSFIFMKDYTYFASAKCEIFLKIKGQFGAQRLPHVWGLGKGWNTKDLFLWLQIARNTGDRSVIWRQLLLVAPKLPFCPVTNVEEKPCTNLDYSTFDVDVITFSSQTSTIIIIVIILFFYLSRIRVEDIDS